MHVQLLRQAQLPAWVFPEGHNPMVPAEVPGGSGLDALKGVDENKLAQLLAEALQRQQAAEGGGVKKEEGKDDVKAEVKQEVKEEVKKEEEDAEGAARAGGKASTSGKRPAEEAGLAGTDDGRGAPEQQQPQKRPKAMEPASPQTSGMDDVMPEVFACLLFILCGIYVVCCWLTACLASGAPYSYTQDVSCSLSPCSFPSGFGTPSSCPAPCHPSGPGGPAQRPCPSQSLLMPCSFSPLRARGP